MNWRDLITLLSASVIEWPFAAHAQQPAKLVRIGWLGVGLPSAYANWVEALRAGLRDLGYVEGTNLVIEFRWAETVDQLPELAAELVRMKVHVIFASSSTQVEAARQATKTIPIVFATHADPVGVGHVTTSAQPGGNMTGLMMLLTELVAKELEILKEALPRAKRVGVLGTPTAPSHAPALKALEAAAENLGIQLLTVPTRALEDFDAAFSTPYESASIVS